MTRTKPSTRDEYLRRYPRTCAHVIAESLGYATPLVAAAIVQDASENRPNYCEWIYSCYRTSAREAVNRSIRNRALHRGHMASYPLALDLVRQQLRTGEGPMFASWF